MVEQLRGGYRSSRKHRHHNPYSSPSRTSRRCRACPLRCHRRGPQRRTRCQRRCSQNEKRPDSIYSMFLMYCLPIYILNCLYLIQLLKLLYRFHLFQHHYSSICHHPNCNNNSTNHF